MGTPKANQKPKKRGKETDKTPPKQMKEKAAQRPKPKNARGDTASERPDRGTT